MKIPVLHNELLLLERIAQGDEVAFGQLYQHYFVQLQPVFFSYTQSADQTEEILQETFIRVWLSRDKLPGIVHFRGWLFKVATHVYLKAVRKRLVYEHHLDQLAGGTANNSPVTPQEATYVGEVQRLVEEAVGALPDQRRRIYEMSRKQGLRIEEIARELGITTRTVKNTLSVALQAIRDHLERSGHGPLIAVYACLQLL